MSFLSIFDVTAISLGAVMGSLMGSLITLGIRRWLARRDAAAALEARKKDFALSLHSRFNSAEVLKAREEAERLMIRHTGAHLFALKSDADAKVSALWMVAREYEFLSIVIEERAIDERIIAQYFVEIFVYWNLHFDTIYDNTDFVIVKRLKSLEAFFRKHHDASVLATFRQRSIDEVNRLRNEAGLGAFVFD